MNDARTQHQLEASLDHLLARVTTLRVLRLRPEEQTCLVQAIERTRMQLLGSPEPVLVVVLADGTGVGKSALINALAGAPIAVVGDTRPTTTTLHVYHHYEVAAGALPTELASVASFVSHDRPQLRTKVLIDTPDLDSFATQHRTITRQVLKAAGLVLYVFSPEKYLDERTWSVLREEQHFSASAAVLNKTDRVSLEHRSSIFLCSDSMVDQCLLSTQQGGSAMRPPLWQPPVELSTADHAIIKRIRRAKLFVFLRQHRHTLFADPLQQELATL